MPTPANSINEATTGICGFTGTAFTASPVTQFDVLVGGASSSTIGSVGPGSAGQVLQSGGNAANPAYSTATYPATAGTSGNVLTSDGTNFVSSAPTTVGTFTPTLSLGTVGTSSFTYSAQVGNYTKIGNVVFFTTRVVLTNFTIGTGSGNVILNGLPFASASGGTNTFSSCSFQNITFGIGVLWYCGLNSANTSVLSFPGFVTSTGQSILQASGLSNTSIIQVTGFYFV